jgi:hypothetical protein
MPVISPLTITGALPHQHLYTSQFSGPIENNRIFVRKTLKEGAVSLTLKKGAVSLADTLTSIIITAWELQKQRAWF